MSNLDPGFLLTTTGAATHPGLVRPVNEDRFLVLPESGVWAVADGMGGHEAGALASQTIVAALRSISVPASATDLLAQLEDRIIRADAQLKEIARQHGHNAVIGSTVAVLLLFDRHYACVWSGDSRLYRVRAARIAQISRDHTEVQELIDQGVLHPEEAKTWPRRNVVTRALGAHGAPELDLDQGPIEPGDVFVICSDGLTSYVADDEILAHTVDEHPQAACDALLALALERGGADNITVVIVRCSGSSVQEGTLN